MTFSGRAVYDSGVFEGIAEDVADVITMLSPRETPLLDYLGDAPYPASNTLHEWLEESLCPNTVVSSNALTETGTALTVAGGTAGYIQTGHLIENETSEEMMQVASVSGNNLYLSRGFASTSATTYVAGTTFWLIADAALEGADVSGDISRPRSRKANYCQIFKKDIIVSGTEQAVRHLGGVTSEYAHQQRNRLAEALRDLEKAVIRGRFSGTTLGSSTAYRTMDGLLAKITTNIKTVSTFTETWFNSVIESAWDNGGTDVGFCMCGKTVKKEIDALNDSRVRVTNDENRYRQSVDEYESTFGTVRILMSRWMPANKFIVAARDRIRVMPLTGRSFRHIPIARTGDSEKGMVIGEYTLEVRGEEGMAQGEVG